MAQYEEITIDQGTDVAIEIRLINIDGTKKNLAGYVVNAQLRRTAATPDSDAINFSSIISDPASNGIITLLLTSEQTEALLTPRYFYDVKISYADSDDDTFIERILYGVININNSYTSYYNVGNSPIPTIVKSVTVGTPISSIRLPGVTLAGLFDVDVNSDLSPNDILTWSLDQLKWVNRNIEFLVDSDLTIIYNSLDEIDSSIDSAIVFERDNPRILSNAIINASSIGSSSPSTGSFTTITANGKVTFDGRTIDSDRSILDTLASAGQVAPISAPSWAILNGLTSSIIGAGAEVLDVDSGWHIDPIDSDSAPNAGTYSWSSIPVGWKWIGPTGLSGKAPIVSPTFITSISLGDITLKQSNSHLFSIEDISGNTIAGIESDGRPFGFIIEDSDSDAVFTETVEAPAFRAGNNLIQEDSSYIFIIKDIAGNIVASIDSVGYAEGFINTANGSVFTETVEAPAFRAGNNLIQEDSDYVFVIADLAGNIVASIDSVGYAEGFGVSESTAVEAEFITWNRSLDSDKIYSWLPINCMPIFWVAGQSNSTATNTDSDALISGTAVYPTKAIMPVGGPRLSSAPVGDLVPLIEIVTGGSRETLSSGFANNLIAMIENNFGYQPTVAVFVAGQPATPITELTRGHTKYNIGLAAVRNCVEYALENGLIPIFMGTLWVHGESDSSIQRESYKRALLRHARDIADDMMAITGQALTPRFFASQTRAGSIISPDQPNWYEIGSPIGLIEADGGELVRCVGPMYPLPISSDLLHLACAGQYWNGVQFARAVFGEYCGPGFHPIKCVGGRYIDSKTIRLEYNVPDKDNLIIRDSDEILDTTISTKGFMVSDKYDNIVSIASVTVPHLLYNPTINDKFVDIEFDSDIEGPIIIRYAQRRDSSGDGPINGGRGCLATETPYVDLLGIERRHWAPAQTIKV